MEYVRDFLSNYVLASAFFGWLTAQVIKVGIALFEKPRKNILKILFSTGGMPSSHTAAVVALAIACGIFCGLDSPEFAIGFVLSGVVMIDASGVRYETGKQAIIIKQITKKLFSDDAESINSGLKELVGHTPFQVIMGALLGIVTAIVTAFCMGVL